MDLIALPAPPVTVMELPVPAVVEINLPVVAVSVLPVGFIPMVPEHTTFAASSSGAATVAAKPTTRSAATGVGAVQVLTRAVVAAAASGSGKFTAPAYVVGQAFPTTIKASGAGSATVTSAAGSAVAAGAAGLANVRPTVVVLAAASGLGSGTVSPGVVVRGAATGIGAATVAAAVRVVAAASGSGAATVSGRPPFEAQGMDKSGTQNPNSGNFAKVNGWTARANSSVVNDGLVVIGAGAATVDFQVQFTQTTGHQARLDLNGSPVADGNSFSGTGISSGSVSLTLAAGDVLELYGTSSLSSRSAFGTATFVTITPVT